MADQTSTPQQTEESGPTREVTEIARWVLGISGLVIITISLVVLIGAWRTGSMTPS